MQNSHTIFDAAAFDGTSPYREKAALDFYRAPSGSEQEAKALERYRATVQQALAAALITT